MTALSSGAVVSLRGVSVSLDAHRVLDNLKITIAGGERVVITGQNGAGKTTLLRTIIGLVKPTEGECVVLGRKIGENGHPGHQIAYLNQGSIHVDFPISAYEVAEIGIVSRKLDRQSRHREIDAAMELTGCNRLSARSFARLSGGEKQKVSLARCLVQKPQLLLLDEPCASLDPDSKSELFSILEEINRRLGTTLLMVSHDEETRSREGWRLEHLEDGRFVGNPAYSS